MIEIKSVEDAYRRLWYEEGEDDGLLRGMRQLTRRQLEKKFGSVPDHVQQRLETMDEEELDRVAGALLDARTLDELGL